MWLEKNKKKLKTKDDVEEEELIEREINAAGEEVEACSPPADSSPVLPLPASPSPPPPNGKKKRTKTAAVKKSQKVSYDDEAFDDKAFVVDEDEGEEDWMDSPSSLWSPTRKRRSSSSSSTRRRSKASCNRKTSPEKRGSKRVLTETGPNNSNLSIVCFDDDSLLLALSKKLRSITAQ